MRKTARGQFPNVKEMRRSENSRLARHRRTLEAEHGGQVLGKVFALKVEAENELGRISAAASFSQTHRILACSGQ